MPVCRHGTETCGHAVTPPTVAVMQDVKCAKQPNPQQALSDRHGRRRPTSAKSLGLWLRGMIASRVGCTLINPGSP